MNGGNLEGALESLRALSATTTTSSSTQLEHEEGSGGGGDDDATTREEEEEEAADPGRGIKLFGLRLLMASDDFVFPAMAEILTRSIMIGVLVLALDLYLLDEKMMKSRYATNILVYLIAILCLCITQFLLNVALGWSSRQGVIWDPNEAHSRRWVAPLVHVIFIAIIVEFSTNVFGLVAVVAQIRSDPDFFSRKEKLGLFLVFLSLWLFLLVRMTVGICVIKDFSDACWRTGRRTPNRVRMAASNAVVESFGDKSSGVCINLLSILCFRQDNVRYFHEAAEIFREVFSPDVFLLSDIVSALVILFTEAESSNHRCSASRSTVHRPPMDGRSMSPPPPSGLLHYMKYAYAMYGSSLYLIHSASTFQKSRQILRNLRCGCGACCCCCCGCCSPQEDFVTGDGCCMCEVATVKATIPELEDDDIVCMSFKNLALVSPFMVVLDHDFKTIVITIRGSGSVPDLVTVMAATPKPFNEVFKAESQHQEPTYAAHSGILEAAYYIYKKLKDEHILDKAFVRCDDYTIVVTGHSLGAGIAVILGFYLRMIRATHVFAFGPPGGLLNYAAWKASTTFTTSLVVGNDVITRLTMSSIYKFRERMRFALRECDQPKYQILYKGLSSGLQACVPCICCRRRRRQDRTRMATTSTTNSSHADSPTSLGSVESSSEHHRFKEELWPIMFPPGEIYHLEGHSDPDNQPLMLTYVKNPQFYSDIIVSPNMFTDHFPQTYLKALEKLSSRGATMT